MALYYKLVVITVIMLVCAKITLQEVGLYRSGKNVKIGNLLHLHGYRLNMTPLATEEFQNEMKCLTSCVKTNECFSLNVKKQANGVLCELLNVTMYQYPKNLTQDASSSHWFARGLTACIPDPCPAFATCKLPEDSSSLLFICVYKTDYNFALRKPTAQSSTYSDFLSGYAVDGVQAEGCYLAAGVKACAHTWPTPQPWWRVDLQIIIPVARVVITNRKGWHNGLVDFEIKIGDSLVNEGRDNPKCGDRQAILHRGTEIISCSPPLPGRYVVIQSFFTNSLVMTEVQVFASNLEVE